jgi:hypothetical protein
MSGAIIPLPQYAFMAWYSVKKKHRDKFTFTFYVFSYENTLRKCTKMNFGSSVTWALL